MKVTLIDFSVWALAFIVAVSVLVSNIILDVFDIKGILETIGKEKNYSDDSKFQTIAWLIECVVTFFTIVIIAFFAICFTAKFL